MYDSDRALYPYVRKCHAHKHYQKKSQNISDNHCGKFAVFKINWKFELLDICPYSANNETDCKENEFFCELSKSCVHQDKTCDGIINCVQGEDEDWKLCKTKFKFDETATIECYQAKRGSYNLLIKATPCSGECKDENCDQDWKVLSAFISFTFVVIILISSYIHFKTTNKYPTMISDAPENIDDETAKYRSGLKGDSLVQIKVLSLC